MYCLATGHTGINLINGAQDAKIPITLFFSRATQVQTFEDFPWICLSSQGFSHTGAKNMSVKRRDCVYFRWGQRGGVKCRE